MNQFLQRNRLLLAATGICVVLWFLPGGQYLSLPLLYLNTIFHEVCHALAALATGGSVARMEIHGTGSGVTLVSGGFGIVVASAGYVGASVIGALLLSAGKRLERSRFAMGACATLIAIALILWIRGDGIGIAASIVWIAAFAYGAYAGKGDGIRFACMFLGLQQCLYAFQSFLVLLKVNTVPGVQNDAALAAQYLPLPPMLYATAWAALSCFLVLLTLRSAWSEPSTDPDESQEEDH